MARDDELGQEGQEEQDDLRIDGVGNDALEKEFAWALPVVARLADAGAARTAQRIDTQPHQVKPAAHLERREGLRRRGNQGADAEHRQQGVAQAAECTTQAEGDAGQAAFRHAYAEDHHVVRAGGDGNDGGGEQETEELFSG